MRVTCSFELVFCAALRLCCVQFCELSFPLVGKLISCSMAVMLYEMCDEVGFVGEPKYISWKDEGSGLV